MERLPNELWQHICYHSNTEILKILRLVHPIFNDLAARVLFQTVYVAVFKYSLRNLSRIATHPVLRFYVHKIMFLDHVLADRYYDYDIWLEIIDLRALSDPSLKMDNQTRKILRDTCHLLPDVPFSDCVVASVDLGSGQTLSVSEKDLVNSHVRYMELCLEQLYLFPENEIDLTEVDPNAEHGVIPKPRHRRALDYISHAVKRLINLRAIETFEEVRQLERTHGTAWDSEGAPRSFLSRLQRETLLKDPFQDPRVFHYIRNPTVASQPTMVLLKALCPLLGHRSSSLGMPKLDLIIDALPWSFWMHGFGSLWARDSEAVLAVLSRLRSLEIRFCIGRFDGPSQDPSPLTNQMTEFMKGLKDVEHLKLTFHFSILRERPIPGLPQRAGVPFLDISDVFQQISFERLSCLKIGSCSFNEEVLVAFMQRHSTQLKRLEANGVNLIGGSCSWRSAIQRVAPVMSLDVAHLRCLLDEEIMTVKSDADLGRTMNQYDEKASLYLELNGNSEYPSLTDLALKSPLNYDNLKQGSQVSEV